MYVFGRCVASPKREMLSQDCVGSEPNLVVSMEGGVGQSR